MGRRVHFPCRGVRPVPLLVAYDQSKGIGLMLLIGVLALAALWLLAGILRNEHRKTQRKMHEIRQLDRDFARVIRQSRIKRDD